MTGYLPDGKKKQRCKMKITKNQLRRIIRRQLLEVKHLPNDVIEYDDGNEAMAALGMKTSGFSTVDEYDQGIELMARLYSDGRAADTVYKDLYNMSDLRIKGAGRSSDEAFRKQYPGYSPDIQKAREDVMASYKSGNRDWKDMLKKTPDEIKKDLFAYKPSRREREKFGLGEFAIAENRIRKAVRAALLNENWWMDQPWSDNRHDHTHYDSLNSDYNYEAKMTFSRQPEERHRNHVAQGSSNLISQYIRMQLQDVKEAGLKPEEVEQLRSLKASKTLGRNDVPYMYPAIVDRLGDFHDPASQEKFRPIADKVRKDAAEARAKRKAEREEEDRKRAERAAKRKFKKPGKAYDKYLKSIADMQRNMDAVDELSRHVDAIAKSGGSVGEMAESFIEEILEPSINYNDDDINGLLGQLDDEIKDAIMKKFNPSIASM
jgi:hypothetical protein